MTPVLVSLIFAVAPPASDHGKAVVDRAGLFSPSAVAEAQRLIDAVRSAHATALVIETPSGRIDTVRNDPAIGLMIETAAELPELPAAKLRKMSGKEAKARLRAIAQDHADAAGCDGLYVLIVKDPPNVTVVGWPGQRELDISDVKRENLRKYLARELAIDPNRALRGACGTFEDIVQSIQARPPSPFAPTSALALIGSLFGVWILLRIIRSRVVRPAPPIYQPAMLGSLFGVPSAYWIYDRLFHAEHPLIHTPVIPPPEPPAELAPKDIGDLL